MPIPSLLSRGRCVVPALAFALAAFTLGAMPGRAAEPQPTPPAAPLPVPKERTVVTHHTVRVAGATLAYAATAGTLLLRDEKDAPTASVFYTAYTLPGAHRPLTFLFNGGPGSSSMWLHIGSVGPRRIVTNDAANTPPPPYRLVENPQTLLDVSDLVFVDAVGTGFSSLAGKGEPKDYFGIDQDARAFAQFVRRYVARFDRWNSPKFLFGESYGTTRSANLVNVLQNQGMDFDGVVLLSTVLNFSTLGSSGPSDDLVYPMFLPTEAAVAWYHDRVPNKPANLESFLEDARRFAGGDYARALARGSLLDDATRARVVEKLHALTGLSKEFIALSDLRVGPNRFEKELLRDRHLTVGRLDGRYLGADLDAAGDSPEYDPTDAAISGPFTSAFNAYVRDDLKWQPEGEYKPTNYGVVNKNWDFKRTIHASRSGTNVAGDLAEAMTKNPNLRVFSANGYYDLATPFFATEYTLDHLGIAPALQAHVTYGAYASGHMVYMNPPSLVKFKTDLQTFYTGALK